MHDKKPKPPSRSGARLGAGCMALFALPFAAVGLYMGWKLASELLLWAEARSWVERLAVILSVELERHANDGEDTLEVLAEYRYEYDGLQYTSDRVGVHSEPDNVSSYHQKMHDELRAAMQAKRPVPCFVDPDDPSRALLDRSMRPLMLVFYAPFVLVFGGAGFGMLVASVYTARSGDKVQRLAAAALDEPWLWREDWKEGVLRSSNRAGAIGLGLFAAFWNAISMPLAVLFFVDEKDREWWVVLLMSLFPMIGIGLMLGALYLVWRWLRFGESTLRLASVPGVVGGQLAGVVLAPSGVQPTEGFQATLTCTQTTSSGDDDRTEALWQDERRITRTLADHEPGRIGVPIVFTIPSDAPPTDEERRIVWDLKVQADLPGVDYLATFEVPVFRTVDSREGVTVDDQTLSEYEQAEPLDRLLAAEGIVADETGAIDGVRYVCPPGRNRWASIGLTVFMLIWNGITAGLFIGGVGWIAWVFAAFGLLILWGTIDTWLACSELIIVGDHWRVRNGWAGLRGAGREFVVDEVLDIDAEKSMSNTSGKEVTQWNNLVAELTDGHRVVLVRHVKSRQAERALLADLRRRAGLEDQDTTPESPWDDLEDAPAE